MLKFPLTFEVQASAPMGISSLWQAKAGQLDPVSCAIPVEFMGPGSGYSPEDFFAMALLNCLIATYKVYMEKSNQTFSEIRGKILLTVDRMPDQPGFAMTSADIYLEVSSVSDPEKGRKILDQAIRDCAVSNSIKCGKTFHIKIS